MRCAVVFGAGSIGRGFIGASLSRSGWQVTFVEVLPGLVEQLNQDGCYRQVVVGSGGEWVNLCQGIRAVLLSDHAAVDEALRDADLAVTAVGADNLPAVAEALVRMLPGRRAAGRPELDLLLCENLHAVAQVMRSYMQGYEDAVGLVAASVGRMVPVPVADPAYPTQVKVEAYDLLPYDATALKGDPPEVSGFVPIWDGFSMYTDRKLYVYNMGHCVVAYLGDLWGYEYIWQAVSDLGVRYLARGAMLETGAAIAAIHGVPLKAMLLYIDDLLARFGNRSLGDSCARAGRDPWRKMQPSDRLIGGYATCLRVGIEPVYLALAVALGAWRLASVTGWTRRRVEEYLESEVFTRCLDARGRGLVWDLWRLVEGKADATALAACLDRYVSRMLIA